MAQEGDHEFMSRGHVRKHGNGYHDIMFVGRGCQGETKALLLPYAGYAS